MKTQFCLPFDVTSCHNKESCTNEIEEYVWNPQVCLGVGVLNQLLVDSKSFENFQKEAGLSYVQFDVADMEITLVPL